MPRTRNWVDVTFYRPDKSVSYQYIDALFCREIDWQLISLLPLHLRLATAAGCPVHLTNRIARIGRGKLDVD